MRRRRAAWEVYSLSAIDLFASAMGAFVILAIILMPDYQREVRSEGEQAYLAELTAQTEALLQETETGQRDLLEALLAAQTRHFQLQAQLEEVSSELETVNAERQARMDQPPPPPPVEEPIPDPTGMQRVTFRFLGLKTNRTRILFLVDLNAFLAPHADLVVRSVERAMESLDDGYQFGILTFQQLDSGPRLDAWPGQGLAAMSNANRREASRFLRRATKEFRGASPLLAGIEAALQGPADAIILFSDGLPNPAYNQGLGPNQLLRRIIQLNQAGKEIHAVTLGDYFKYRGTVEFMEKLANSNQGGFLALAN